MGSGAPLTGSFTRSPASPPPAPGCPGAAHRRRELARSRRSQGPEAAARHSAGLAAQARAEMGVPGPGRWKEDQRRRRYYNL